MSDIPTLAEEIERKAVTELQRIMHGLATRRISVVSAAASLQTMWEMAAGLVAGETMTLIGESATTVQKALHAKERPEETAVLTCASGFYIVQRFAESVKISYGIADGTPLGGFKLLVPPVEEIHPAQWASDKFKSSCEALGKSMCRVL